MALLRIVEPTTNSCVFIDGIDIASINRLKLRRHMIAVIPQDTVLFSGTLRFNMDPFDQYSDEHIWKALEKAQIKSFIVSSCENGLDHVVAENGSNFSYGQRKLIVRQ